MNGSRAMAVQSVYTIRRRIQGIISAKLRRMPDRFRFTVAVSLLLGQLVIAPVSATMAPCVPRLCNACRAGQLASCRSTLLVAEDTGAGRRPNAFPCQTLLAGVAG